jgi:hypothetical protein
MGHIKQILILNLPAPVVHSSRTLQGRNLDGVQDSLVSLEEWHLLFWWMVDLSSNERPLP